MADKPTPNAPANIALSDAHVLQFLRANPAFFTRYPELLDRIEIPERALGDGVVDFQAYQLKNLKSNTKDLEQKYNGLVDFCRANLSSQSEIQEVILRVINTKSLDQLLEVIAIDMPALFDLDVVRLIVEAPTIEYMNDNLDIWQQSGVTLVQTGVTDAALAYQPHRAVEDTASEPDAAVEEVFAGAMGLSRSVVMLKLDTPDLDLPLVLAMGARQTGRFHPKQSPEPLKFLGRVLSIYLERYLSDLSM